MEKLEKIKKIIALQNVHNSSNISINKKLILEFIQEVEKCLEDLNSKNNVLQKRLQTKKSSIDVDLGKF